METTSLTEAFITRSEWAKLVNEVREKYPGDFDKRATVVQLDALISAAEFLEHIFHTVDGMVPGERLPGEPFGRDDVAPDGEPEDERWFDETIAAQRAGIIKHYGSVENFSKAMNEEDGREKNG